MCNATKKGEKTVEKLTDVVKNSYMGEILIEVVRGNPNGDPDADGAPRILNEHGLISPYAVKRLVRDLVDEVYKCGPLFISRAAILNDTIAGAKVSEQSTDEEKREQRTKDLLSRFFDLRVFGALLSTGGSPANNVRGPVQIAFGLSIDPVFDHAITLTRMARAKKKLNKNKQKETENDDEGTGRNQNMGRTAFIPYALYKITFTVSAHDAKKSGMTNADLLLFLRALQTLFDNAGNRAHCCTVKKVVIWKSEDSLLPGCKKVLVCARKNLERAAENYDDYTVTVDPTELNLHEEQCCVYDPGLVSKAGKNREEFFTHFVLGENE